MPEWLRLLSSVALLAGGVLATWLLLNMFLQRRALLAPDPADEAAGDG